MIIPVFGSFWPPLYGFHDVENTGSVIITVFTLEHKTSHKGQFYEIEMYASSERLINNISIDVWFVSRPAQSHDKR